MIQMTGYFMRRLDDPYQEKIQNLTIEEHKTRFYDLDDWRTQDKNG
jgi:hypothetical protein